MTGFIVQRLGIGWRKKVVRKTVIYEWPESQKCIECVYGKFIMSDDFTNSDYLCMAGCADNDGIDCPEFVLDQDI